MSDRFEPSIQAVLETSVIVTEFDEALARATAPSECVQIAARIGMAVRVLMDAQDRALDKADSY